MSRKTGEAMVKIHLWTRNSLESAERRIKSASAASKE